MTVLRLFVASLLFLGVISLYGQNRLPAFQMNERLGRGVNMGNMFEAPSEEAWGNPWNPQYFKLISDLGFDHVRLPVRWETDERSMAAAPYTINGEFLKRIQQVVDTALKYDLHIIVNMHHHDALFENPDAQKARFLSQWSQIAAFFKDYPDKLLFEVLNEPHGNLTPVLWNQFFAEALAEIRKTNPMRVVLMGVAEYGGLGALNQLQLPEDDYIIVTPHYYNPFPFTHQGAEWVAGADAWLGTPWMDTEAERETVANEFAYAIRFSEENRIPIYVGEFGAYSKADMASRERWTTFIARWLEQNGFSWAYWEFSAGFGIYNPTSKQYVTPLVDALVHNQMPAATVAIATLVYESNFSTNTDGWTLVEQQGADGTLSMSGGLNVSIVSPGTEIWHLQLLKHGLKFEKGKSYRISFTGSSLGERNVTFYAGKASDPWNAYSSAMNVTVNTAPATYSSTFTMTGDTDAAARLVFDLGLNTHSVTVTNVKVEELSFPVTAIPDNAEEVIASPNPMANFLTVNSPGATGARLVDPTGRTIREWTAIQEGEVLDVSGVADGPYILILRGAKQGMIRLIKHTY